MPLQLLPKSAAAFAPRAAPTIVLNTKVEPWLTQALRRIAKVRRPLHSTTQHYARLTEVLGGENAIWTLCSLLFPKAPESELRKDENPLIEAISNYELMHVQAYVVHVDMVSQYEVAYKLNKETIDALIEYHRDVYSVDAAASLFDWPEKNAQVKKMQEEFVQAVNRFVFRTGVRALEGLEEDGAGELLDGRAEDVKRAIMNLFSPLLPPPPRITDVVIPAQSYVQQPTTQQGWWQPTHYMPSHSMPSESWNVLPSTPSPSVTQCSEPSSQHQQYWSGMNFDAEVETAHVPSPTPSGSQYDYSSCESSIYSSPASISVMPVYAFPSQLPQNCGLNMAMHDMHDMDEMGWGFNSFATPQYAAIM